MQFTSWRTMARRRPAEALRRLLLVGLGTAAVALVTTGPALADDRPDGAELATAGAMMVVIVVAFIAAGLGLVWSWKNGEYDEPEEIKYQMLATVEDEQDFWGMGTHDDDWDDENVVTEKPRVIQPAARG
jgi:cbb3-type cytochrome oxidase maturation protein